MSTDERTTYPIRDIFPIQTPEGFHFQPGEEFLVAVQRAYQLGETIEVRGLVGRIVEQISHSDYLAVWMYRGFDSDAISIGPKFYYRCQRLGSPQRATSETEVRGDRESA